MTTSVSTRSTTAPEATTFHELAAHVFVIGMLISAALSLAGLVPAAVVVAGVVLTADAFLLVRARRAQIRHDQYVYAYHY